MAGSPEGIVTGGVGLRLGDELQGRWRLQGLWAIRLFQAAEAIEDMLFGRLPRLQCPGNGLFDQRLIVEQNQGKDIDHLSVTAQAFQQACLQLPEAVG
jgi:hypothetical protein